MGIFAASAPSRRIHWISPIHRHARQLDGVAVELDPQHTLLPERREGARQAERIGIEISAMLDIVERAQRDVGELRDCTPN